MKNQQASNSLRYGLLLTGIILVGAALRFYNYNTLTLFNDELSALTRLRYDGFRNLIVKGVMTDMHPAGVQVFLYFLTRLFGNSEAIVRLPFVLAGIGSIPLLYLIGKRWFGETTGILAASCLAALQYPVYFSQMARPYSPGLFFCLLLVYFLGRTIDNHGENKQTSYKNYIGFILAGTACMYIHYFSFLFAAIAGFTGIFLVDARQRKALLVSGLVMVLLALPHWPVYKHQLLVGGLGGPEGWLGPPGKDTFRHYLHYVFNDSELVFYLLWGICIASFVWFRKTLELTRYHLVCLLFFLLPFGIAYYYSIWKNPVLQFSILLFSFPFLLLFIFSFIQPALSFQKLVPSMLVLLIILTGSTVIEKDYYRTEHYAVFRQLAERTIELNNTYGDRNITNTFNVFEPYYMNYYFEKFNRPVYAAQYRCMEPEKTAQLRDIVNRSTTPFFLHAWSNTYEPPEVEEIIRKQYPYRLLYDKHFNSALSFYSKKPADSAAVEQILFTATHDFENFRWPNDEAYMSRDPVFSGSYSADLGGKEYGNTFSSTLADIGYRDSCIISISCQAWSKNGPSGALMVVTVLDRDEKTLFWQGGKFDTYVMVPGRWQQFFFTCTLPGKLDPAARIKLFPWNKNKTELWIDDLEIKVKMSGRANQVL